MTKGRSNAFRNIERNGSCSDLLYDKSEQFFFSLINEKNKGMYPLFKEYLSSEWDFLIRRKNMKKRKWTAKKGQGGFGTLRLGEKPEQLPEKAFISLTRGEGLNFLQLIINQLLTLMVMNQMKKAHGLLYAELHGELKNRRGSGQTMTVWDGKTMPKFRNKSSHGITMKFFAWVIHRKNTKTYYLTFSADGKIPSTTEVTDIIKRYGKFYDGGKLARKASPPNMKRV
jgi:hypothetical protein